MGSRNDEFDEDAYLATHPDVAAAVKQGHLKSGHQHYRLHGFKERRDLRPDRSLPPLTLPADQSLRLTRRDRILANLDLETAQGLEIGALASPLVRRSEGAIIYVDHADTESLRGKYAGDPGVDIARIVDVDAVWGEKTLRECVAADQLFDYVVASHVAEHVPDLITWLAEVREILQRAGTLRLALPDRRYTFDYLRVESRAHDAIDAYIRRARAPLPRMIAEHFSLTRPVDAVAAWNGTLNVPDADGSPDRLREGLSVARHAFEAGHYQDVHCWVFTPHSFATLCIHLAEVGLFGFRCEYWFDTLREELEFVVALAPSDDETAIRKSWEAMRSATRP